MITTLLVDFFGVLKHPQDNTFGIWNEDLLLYLTSLSELDKYVFTNSTVHLYEEVWQKLQPIFTELISAPELQISKKDPNAYKIVAEKIGKQPSEILFIDDTPSNVEAAQQAGLNAVAYTSFEELKKVYKQLHKSV